MTLDYFSRNTNMTTNMTDTTFHFANDLCFEHFILSGVKYFSLESYPPSQDLSLYADVLEIKTDMSPHQRQDVNAFIHLEVTLSFVNTSCLILEFVGFDPLKKKHKLCDQPPGSHEAVSALSTLTQHMWRLVLGRPRGSSPAGQVTKSSQGLTTSSWLHLPRSLLHQVSMASTWSTSIPDTFSIPTPAQNTPTHPRVMSKILHICIIHGYKHTPSMYVAHAKIKSYASMQDKGRWGKSGGLRGFNQEIHLQGLRVSRTGRCSSACFQP